MQADTDCELLELHGRAFRTCVKQHQVVHDIVRDYARAFVETLNLVGATTNRLSDVQQNYLNEEPVLKFLAEPWIQELSTASHNSSPFYSSGNKASSSRLGWLSRIASSPAATRHA
eukprot:4778881-Amphidinium_carterae.1